MIGFVEVSQEEMMAVDGGFVVVTTAFIGACVVWGVNFGLVAVAIDIYNKKK